jgi:hypothetical protein
MGLNEVVSGFIYVVIAFIISSFKILPPDEVLDAVLNLLDVIRRGKDFTNSVSGTKC